MAKRPTIHDVARAAGVSAATVSNALSGRRRVEGGTLLRVQEVARTLRYVPDMRAQRLRTGRPAAIALVSSMPTAVAGGPSRLGFMMEIAAAAAVAALEGGLAVVLVPPTDDPAPSLTHLDVAGALVVEPAAGDRPLRFLLDRGCPVVSIGRPGADMAIPFVDLRTGDATTLLLEHLAAAGSRRIAAIVGRERRASYAQSIAAYERFAAERGMAPTLLRLDETGGEAAGRDATLALLAADPALDALCVTVDAFAVGAVAAARALGRAIPGTLRIATRYDGLRAKLSNPPLTAVDLHLDAVARRAVALLLERLGVPPPAEPTVVPPPTLVPRASSVTR